MTTTTVLAPEPGLFSRVHGAVRLDEQDMASLRRLAVVALVVLNLFDILLTRKLLGMGASEANPIMAPFVSSHWGIAVKVGLPIAFGIRHLRAPLKRQLVLGLCWVCVLYMAVVLWNSHLLEAPHLIGL